MSGAQEFVVIVAVLWTLIGLLADSRPMFDDQDRLIRYQPRKWQ